MTASLSLSGDLEFWDIDKLVPYEDNAKSHPEEQITKLAKNIKELGFDVPIVIDDTGLILKGHGRRLAAMRLGLPMVPVVVRRGLNDAQKAAIRITDNTLALLGDIDMASVARELNLIINRKDLDFNLDFEDFGVDGLDIDLVGLEDAINSPNAPTSSKAPEPREVKDYSKPDLSREKTAVSLFQVVADCRDEEDQEKAYNILVNSGYKARPLTI